LIRIRVEEKGLTITKSVGLRGLNMKIARLFQDIGEKSGEWVEHGHFILFSKEGRVEGRD
jgi:hypothetical protein